MSTNVMLWALLMCEMYETFIIYHIVYTNICIMHTYKYTIILLLTYH